MIFFLIFLVIGVAAALLPRFSAALDILFLAPILGVAFGGTAWSIIAMIFNKFITVNAFMASLAIGIVAAQVFLWRLRKDRE